MIVSFLGESQMQTCDFHKCVSYMFQSAVKKKSGRQCIMYIQLYTHHFAYRTCIFPKVCARQLVRAAAQVWQCLLPADFSLDVSGGEDHVVHWHHQGRAQRW